jgi:peptidyl-dipeptidase A
METLSVAMSFQAFLNTFVPKVQKKSKQVNQATWILETTGSKDAAELKAALKTELHLLFHDKEAFQQLMMWDQDLALNDPLLKRQLNILIRAFKPHLIEKNLLEQIAYEEANISLLYSNFRANVNGKSFSENEIREILKNENEIPLRKEIWNASKQIGKKLAPPILKLVELRNEAARSLGYDNYFSMQLRLQEVDEQWLFETFDSLAQKSDAAYLRTIEEIEVHLSKRFSVSRDEVGPWAWSDPFCQEDPMDAGELDALVKDLDIVEESRQFYQAMGLPVEEVLERSDNFERPGKNQHAFCTHIDREGDVRTLNNIQPTVKWLETVLHELGHAVYECGFDQPLPWLLKEPPHMITTEAMALLAGRQAYRTHSLRILAKKAPDLLRQKAEVSLKRRQLIFSRWVLVMTYFERELYRNPAQDLNQLWWYLVEKFQKIKSSGSANGYDWAAKVHIGLAPVYYFSYLLGELLASLLEEKNPIFASKQTGEFLNKMLFSSGNSLSWDTLIEHATGKKLTVDPWLTQFAFQ